MPALWQRHAAPLPRPRPLSGVPVPGLRGVLHPADRDGLRENPAAPRNLGPVAARHRQGRAYGASGAGIGGLTQAAAYPAAASPSQFEHDRANRHDDRHHLRSRRTVPKRRGKKAHPILTLQIHPGGAPTSAKGTGLMGTIARPSSVSSRATRGSSAGGSVTMQTGKPAAT